MPFTIHLAAPKAGIKLRLAKGKYQIPDDIDGANEESAGKADKT